MYVMYEMIMFCIDYHDLHVDEYDDEQRGAEGNDKRFSAR